MLLEQPYIWNSLTYVNSRIQPESSHNIHIIFHLFIKVPSTSKNEVSKFSMTLIN